MKKYFALLLAIALICMCALCSAEEAQLPCTWLWADSVLTVSIAAGNTQAWSVTFDETDLLTQIDESYADGLWTVTLLPVKDAAGIVIVSLVCQSETSDEPLQTIALEIYVVDGIEPVVLSVDGVQVNELPVD